MRAKRRLIQFSAFFFLFILAHLTCSAEDQQSSGHSRSPVRWRGFYLSGQLGNGWSQSHVKYTNANFFNTLGPLVLGSKFHFNSQGFVGGGALGYNFQKKWFVAGLEAGAQYLNLYDQHKSPFFPTIDVYSFRLNCLATAKARVGYAYRWFLPYIAGGWAGGNVKLKLHDTVSDIPAHSTEWANGWCIGAGADFKIIRHFSLGLAYDYIDISYNRDKVSCPLCGTGVGYGTPFVHNHIQTQTLTARINFHL